MATKIVIFEAQRVGEEILKSVKSEVADNFTTGRFDVKIFGPDDVRFAKALKDDRSLGNELKAACAKAHQAFVTELGKFLADQAAKREKLKGDERKKFDAGFSSSLYNFGKAASKKLETTADTETKKRWKATAADNPKELAGVRFEPILIDFLVSFEPVADAAAEQEEEEAETAAEKSPQELLLTQQAISRAARALKEPIENAAKIPDQLQLIQQTVARVKSAYENAPRESQQDDPNTEGGEELDEEALNKSLFNRFGKEIAAAEQAALAILLTFGGGKAGVDPQCGVAVKELNHALKKLGTIAQARKDDRQVAASLEKSLNGISDAVKKLLAIQSEAKVGARTMKGSWLVLKTVGEKKGSALDLIDEALVDLKSPNERLVAVVQLLEQSRVTTGPGT